MIWLKKAEAPCTSRTDGHSTTAEMPPPPLHIPPVSFLNSPPPSLNKDQGYMGPTYYMAKGKEGEGGEELWLGSLPILFSFFGKLHEKTLLKIPSLSQNFRILALASRIV
jgi:hypothetical protein